MFIEILYINTLSTHYCNYMHRILKQSYNIAYLDTIFKYCIIKHYIFNHTIRKYSDSYLYLEYFQKSNLVL